MTSDCSVRVGPTSITDHESRNHTIPMMRLPKFRYYAPRTVREAVAIQRGCGARERVFVAGGTDLYPNMKRRQRRRRSSSGSRACRRCADPVRVRKEPSIGSAVLLSAIENHRRIRRDYPALAPRDRGDLDAAAAQHGDARRQPPARHALQLLRPELRVAQGDRLLHEEGRRHLLGGARFAQVPGRSVGRLGARS